MGNTGTGYYCMSNGVLQFASSATLYVGYVNTGVFDMYGGTNQPGVAVFVGRSSVGTLNLYGGQFRMANSGSYFDMGNQGGAANIGTLNVAGGTLVITNAASEGMIVGRVGTGNVNLSSGKIENYGSLMIARQVGSSGNVLQSGGTWLQRGTTTIGNSAASSFRLTGGSFLGNNVTVGSATLASRLDLSGSNKLFQVGGTLTVGTAATVTNHVQGVAGGVDLTSSASGALVLNGKIAVAFEQNPVVTGPYWGLRWAGDHVAALNALNSANKLTWDTSGMYPQYHVGIYKDATYTYVGVQVNQIIQLTTIITIR